MNKSKLFQLLIIIMTVLLMPVVSYSNNKANTLCGVDKKAIMAKIMDLQIPFIENQGQVDKRVKFYVKTFAGNVFVTQKGEIVYSLVKSKAKPKSLGSYKKGPVTGVKMLDGVSRKFIRLEESLVGGKQTMIQGINKSVTKVNYFIGSNQSKWRSNISAYNEVNIGEVYEGIVLYLKARGKNVEKVFTVTPKGNVENIILNVDGAKGLKVNEGGELEIKLEPNNVIRFTKPYVYQEIEGKRTEVGASYRILPLQDSGTNNQYAYGFRVDGYNKSRPLVIDPSLSYSTYLGGNGEDRGYGIAVDSSGNAYVTGRTDSSDFPTQNPFQGTIGGWQDAFVTKLNSSGTALSYSTYIGGSGDDYGNGIAIDSSGNSYVTGTTNSSDFPTSGHFQGTFGGVRDAFVTKLNSSGTALCYSTYLGGSFDEIGYDIAVDSSGNAYVTGYTSSSNFPTQSPYQWTYGGGYDDAFVTKLDSSATALCYSTYLGGSDSDQGYDIAVDSSGNAYITGATWSLDFPTQNPFQGARNSYSDAFVTKLNSSGTALSYSTYLGGSGGDYGYGIAVDLSRNAYVAGETSSSDFPTESPFQGPQASKGGMQDAFVTKLNTSGTALSYSTYLGGGGGLSSGRGIAVDSSGNAYVAGYTRSPGFPTKNPYQGYNGSQDAFITKLNSSGTALFYSTYHGGSDGDQGYDIAVDSSGNAYVTGLTESSDFPTHNPFQGTIGGGYEDAFVTKFYSLGFVPNINILFLLLSNVN